MGTSGWVVGDGHQENVRFLGLATYINVKSNEALVHSFVRKQQAMTTFVKQLLSTEITCN